MLDFAIYLTIQFAAYFQASCCLSDGHVSEIHRGVFKENQLRKWTLCISIARDYNTKIILNQPKLELAFLCSLSC